MCRSFLSPLGAARQRNQSTDLDLIQVWKGSALSELDPIQVNYVREFVKLSLWYVHKRVRDGKSDFEDAINRRVDIYRKTSLYDGENHPARCDVGSDWKSVRVDLRELFEHHSSDPSTDRLEMEGLDYLWPLLETRLRTTPDVIPSLEERPYGCWRFDARSEAIGIHIMNVYSPRSPLSELFMPFAASLIRLLHDARLEHPSATHVRCGSWLNSVPRFQALFPESWKQSAVYRAEIGHSNGHWGQFVDRRGDFHGQNGRRFRETGQLPYASTVCESPIEEALTHLETTFPDAVEYNLTRSPHKP